MLQPKGVMGRPIGRFLLTGALALTDSCMAAPTPDVHHDPPPAARPSIAIATIARPSSDGHRRPAGAAC
jgi:hypothetical protein